MTPCSRHKGRCYGHCLYVCKLRASSASVDGSLLARVETGESFIKAVNLWDITSNGGCHPEEKSRKHWSLFTKLLFPVTVNLFFCQVKSRAVVYIDCTGNQRKIGLNQMSQMSLNTQNNSTRRPACICILTSKHLIIQFKSKMKD